MTDLLFLHDAYLTTFRATVRGVREDGGVLLDRTAFYPTGGGQPHDIGTLGGRPVIDVRYDEAHEPWHRIDGGGLIPASVSEIRDVDIVGLDKQADGGTHVRTTDEVGRVKVVKTESKGKGNKRIRIEVLDA